MEAGALYTPESFLLLSYIPSPIFFVLVILHTGAKLPRAFGLSLGNSIIYHNDITLLCSFFKEARVRAVMKAVCEPGPRFCPQLAVAWE